MGCEDEVLRVGKKLEKLISSNTSDHAGALDLLKTLRDLPMTLNVLQKTRIGMTVNNFRKSTSNDEAVSLAKTLIKNWKKLLPETNQSSGDKKTTPSNATKMDESSNDGFEQSADSSKGGSDINTDTRDPIRLKCRELIQGALKLPESTGDIGETLDAIQLAADIENAVFNEFKDTQAKYKTRIRSRVSNLRDSKNPTLRENVMLGNILPEKFAKMTAEEMASDSLKELRKKLTKEAIDDHRMVMTGGTTTDLLQCGKCKKKSVTYNQVQTRSADEPMTTFCLCNDCGKRWKFC